MSARPIPKPGAVTGTTSTHDDEHWTERAACRGVDPETFYPDSRGVGEAKQTVEAKAVCARCPVQPDCLQEALERREPWGVWGGELFVAGVVFRQKPRRRPARDGEAA